MYCYLITNKVNGKQYVGITSKTVSQRFYEHIYDAKKGGGKHLCCAIRKYGEESFIVETLSRHRKWECLCRQEVKMIRKYDTYNKGYNHTFGGDGSKGFKHTEEFKNKVSMRHTGKKVSKETRDRLSKALKGKKISNPRKGFKLSEETKRKISETKLRNSTKKPKLRKTKEERSAIQKAAWAKRKAEGRDKQSKETLAKRHKTMVDKGLYAHSEKTKEKMKKSNLAAWEKRKKEGFSGYSDEHKDNISKAIKKHWNEVRHP